MHLARALTLGVSLALPLTTSSGQSDSASSSSAAPPKWEFSLGADPTDLNLSASGGDVHGHFVSSLTRNWQGTSSKFSRQLSLMVGADAPYHGGVVCYGCRTNREYAALTAGVSVDVFNASRFTPYLHTGAGLYYERFGGRESVVGGDALIPNPASNNFSLGIKGGLGVKARLFSHEFFVDETLHAFDVRAVNHGVYPLSIGIRW